jgi:ribonucleoside-diphosphate reductase alpha chain
MGREALPDRRHTWTQKARVGGQTVYLSFGEYPDGRLGEVWVEVAKAGSFVRGVCGALARMASCALQNGVPVPEVVDTLRSLNFPPNGPVDGSGAVQKCSSLADLIALEIEAAYLQPPPPAGKVAGGHTPGPGY